MEAYHLATSQNSRKVGAQPELMPCAARHEKFKSTFFASSCKACDISTLYA